MTQRPARRRDGATRAAVHEGAWRIAATWAAGLLIGAAAVSAAFGESHEEVTVSHGISTFGDLKYPADFPHLDYVNPDAPKGGEASFWGAGTFDSFNPYTRKGRSGSLISSFYDSLLSGTADEIGASYCLICTTVEYPESRDWIVYNLRDDATFTDGSPITAEDVKFTYDIFVEEGLPSFRAVLGAIVESVEVENPYRLKVTFKPESPKRDRVGSVGGLPVFSKAWFETNGYGLDESRLVPNLGSAPYVLDSFDVNQRIVYRRNEDYWAKDHPLNVGRWNYETIRVEYFGDSLAAFEGFKAGAYTLRVENSSKTWAEGYNFPAIASGSVIKAELPDGSIATGQSYAINMRRPQFSDPRVREAIGLMFNFEWSNQALFYGLYARINSLWENSELAAEGVPSPEEVAVLQPLVDEGLLDAAILTEPAVMAPTSGERQLDRRNLRRASALLDEAGWDVGDDGLRRKDGKTLVVEILEDSPTFDRVHNPFIQNLRAAGIDARYERIDPSQYTNRTRSHDFDMVVDQFPMGYEPGAGLQQYFGSATAAESVFNSAGVQDPAVDRLIEVIRNANDRDEMIASVKSLDRVLRAMRFWVPQWFNDQHWVAYFDFYRYPETLPPYALGQLDFWWIDVDRKAELEASGAL
ncbi:extracellular solute-binding protein [Ovoidimarina sediminis]|uniref:extracellular solute-binding protein n=1 Tax=Ovoidimarina sediminis TaxID=3079856 RepID=UPI002908223C|nr:extracellular solute-binding protein [Rhodophyticola sp. MJ-SS7]MDU8944404.1 extracellular solute-binding protein [Rhodophyticola sp. MJ-SS7]